MALHKEQHHVAMNLSNASGHSSNIQPVLVPVVAELSAAVQEAWTHLEHERCCSMAFFDGGLVDAAMAAKLGISVRAAASAAVVSADGSKHTFNSGQGPDMQSAAGNCQHNSSADSGSNGVSEFVVEDHVLFGTAKGEVLFCDASRGGLVVLRMPALE
eukprot:GHRR01037217.1.p1 GENE.GHRR01037217.1~~GHRR01037217.1.p1  ORF type:complete len:158 (+),score=68.37 GHRR01037217.1:875-1348(+)